MNTRALTVGVITAVCFWYTAFAFLCCQGEDGFAVNVRNFLSGFMLLLITIFALQQSWRVRPIFTATTGIALWIVVVTFVIIARPSWDDYGFQRPLHLGWRSAGVFVAASIATYLQLLFVSSRFARRT